MASPSLPQTDPAGFAAGDRIAGYRLEREIGRGGMAVVFAAYDERLERLVALKVLTPALATDEVFRQRFIAESRAAAAVEDPHIIPVYEAGESDGVLFIAMRLVRGGDLRTLVVQYGSLAPDRAEWIVSAVASALDAAHARGLVHRDVKPANMLLDVRPGRPDHVYLSDFGLSKTALSTGGLSHGGQFVGTIDYAAPEQILGRPVDGRTDQYALGCAAFELLCGQPPYPGGQPPAALYSHLSATAPVAASVRPELPAAVDNVFARVLAKSPADRYGCCLDFARALRAALGLKALVVEAAESKERAPAYSDNSGESTLHPAAVNPLAASLPVAAVGTDPRPTSHLTLEPTRAARLCHSRRALVSGAVAVILVTGVAAAIWFGLAATPRQRQAVADRFGGSFPSGLAISQVWRLAGTDGSVLDVSMTISSSSSGPVYARLVEPMPQVALGATAMTFGGVAPEIVGRRMVWDLPVPGRGKDAVLTYQVPVPAAGTSKQELMTYVQAYSRVSWQQVLVKIPAPGVVRKVWISPAKFWLKVNHARHLTAHGRLFSGRLATGADLAGAVWSTSNPGVVSVDSGVVIGEKPGRALVWVNIDGIQAQATVVVSGASGQSGAPQPGSVSEPAVQASTSPSPSPSGTGSSSGSPSPTPTQGSSAPPTSPPTSGSPAPGASSEDAEGGPLG